MNPDTDIPHPDREAWRDRAACRGRNIDLWHPTSRREAARGIAICDDCPVRQECRDHAETHREPHGTWGGITEWDRWADRTVPRRLKPIAHGTLRGHSAHRRRGITVCEPCRAAYNERKAADRRHRRDSA